MGIETQGMAFEERMRIAEEESKRMLIELCDEQSENFKLTAELSQLRAENERLKELTTEAHTAANDYALVIDKQEAALKLKNEALDRLQWAKPNSFGTPMFCFACGAIEDAPHKPDCWHQAARKAGQP